MSISLRILKKASSSIALINPKIVNAKINTTMRTKENS
jgi:hypothetical protein